MIQAGDKIIAVDSCESDGQFPAIIKGTYYIANRVYLCGCGLLGVDVGLQFLRPITKDTCCARCNALMNAKPIVPYYEHSFFRKIEPEYKAVMVDSEISEQAKELIGITETIAR